MEWVTEHGTSDFLQCLIINGYDLSKNTKDGCTQFLSFVRAIQNLGVSLQIGLKSNVELIKIAIILIQLQDDKTVNEAINKIKQAPYDHFKVEQLKIFDCALYEIEKRNALRVLSIFSSPKATGSGSILFASLPSEMLHYIAPFVAAQPNPGLKK